MLTSFEQQRGNIAQRNAQNGFQVKFETLLEKSPESALDFALEQNQEAWCRAAVEKGASLDTDISRGNTRLHLAAKNNNVLMVRMLCNLGANVNAQNFFKETPIGLAAQHMSDVAFELLLNNPGVDLEILNKRKKTVFELVCEHQNPNVSVVVALLKRDDIDISVGLGLIKKFIKEKRDAYVTALLAQKAWVTRLTKLCPQSPKELLKLAHEKNGANQTICAIFYTLFSLYGVKYRDIIQNKAHLDSYDKINEFLNLDDCLSYIEAHGLTSQVSLAALRILKTRKDVKEMESQQLQAHVDQHGENEDAMADKAVKLANKHYEQTVEPYFRDQFLAFSKQGNKDKALLAIEEKIRELILLEIRRKAVDENKQAIVDFIDRHKRNLIKAQKRALTASTKVFTELCPEHAAWRGYNPFAPVSGEWDNLLTHCDSDRNHWTTSVAFAGTLSGKMASNIVRTRAAHYYLAVVEGNDEAVKRNRIVNFIDKLAEIRNTKGLDNPSCFPGSLTRIAQMGAFHDVAQLPPSFDQVLLSHMRTKILTAFKEKIKALEVNEKEMLLHALIDITHDSAADVIKDPLKYPPQYLALRQAFIDSLGTEMSIFEVVKAQVEWEVEEQELILVSEHLLDVARLDIAVVLEEDLQRTLDSVPTPEDIQAANSFEPHKQPRLFALTDLIVKAIQDSLPQYIQSQRKLLSLKGYLEQKTPLLLQYADAKTIDVLFDNLEGSNEAKHAAKQFFLSKIKDIGFQLSSPEIKDPYQAKIEGLKAQLKHTSNPAIAVRLQKLLEALEKRKAHFAGFYEGLKTDFKRHKLDAQQAEVFLTAMTDQYANENKVDMEKLESEFQHEPKLLRFLKDEQVTQSLSSAQALRPININ